MTHYCVLVQVRAHNQKHCAGKFGIPGGGMDDKDESTVKTATREIEEETGLQNLDGNHLHFTYVEGYNPSGGKGVDVTGEAENPNGFFAYFATDLTGVLK